LQGKAEQTTLGVLPLCIFIERWSRNAAMKNSPETVHSICHSHETQNHKSDKGVIDMESITRYLQETQRVLAETTEKPIKKVVSLLFDAWRLRKQVFILGNGGSASTASHMANDLSKATIVVGKPRLRVIALTDNISIITAWANDTSYEAIFKEQLENLLQPGDLVIGISASGNSPNVLRAMEFSKQQGAVTIGWTGRSGGALGNAVDLCVHCPTDDIGMIESVHLVLDHLVTRELHRCIQADSVVLTDHREVEKPNGNGRRLVTVPLAAGQSA
jgi:D-sedoheptulose 7-phosphate isomerase